MQLNKLDNVTIAVARESGICPFTTKTLQTSKCLLHPRPSGGASPRVTDRSGRFSSFGGRPQSNT